MYFHDLRPLNLTPTSCFIHKPLNANVINWEINQFARRLTCNHADFSTDSENSGVKHSHDSRPHTQSFRVKSLLLFMLFWSC